MNTTIFSESGTNIHVKIYFVCLILLGISIPVSLFAMSVSQFLITINWIWEGNFRQKLEILKKRKSILIIVSIYLVHILGLIYTEDFSYALKDLRIKLPMLLLPIIIGTSVKLDSSQIKTILLFYIASVTVSTLLSTGTVLGIFGDEILDKRDISLFISHIRFALSINLSIFILVFYIFNKKSNSSIKEKTVFGIISLWLIFFLFILQSLTGLVVLAVLSFLLLVYLIIKSKSILLKTVSLLASFTLIISIANLVKKSIDKFNNIEEVNYSELPKYTENGNKYRHNLKNKNTENGHYVGLYMCKKELRQEWNKLSKYKFDGKDKKNQYIKYTLPRYLTSKNLRKDSAGVSKLSKKDIELIEKGVANYIFESKLDPYPRIYLLLWEINLYNNGGNPTGHSLIQRFEYLKAAFGIISDNLAIGVGTGDVQASFNSQYKIQKSKLKGDYRRRAHNQFVTFIVTFGIIGFLWIFYAMLSPIYYEEKSKHYFLIIFLIISLVSFLNEDTLETQAGVTFFVYFYSLFILGTKNKKAIPN